MSWETKAYKVDDLCTQNVSWWLLIMDWGASHKARDQIYEIQLIRPLSAWMDQYQGDTNIFIWHEEKAAAQRKWFMTTWIQKQCVMDTP